MAAKAKTMFFCRNCGASAPKWIGKCPSCGKWNTYEEEIVSATESKGFRGIKEGAASPIRLEDVSSRGPERISMNDGELDRVLGGGLVDGSVILLGGEPGIGKSTLMLQIALNAEGRKILYVSGEESEQQIKMRAMRLKEASSELFILNECCVENIISNALSLKPDFLVIDSIQTLYSENIESAAGSIVQIRECAAALQKYAKTNNVSVFVIGHITKDGSLAGPKVLEHVVDTVLQFEGERQYDYRIIRSLKNRFGSTQEIGIYEMRGDGLRQVSNPSEILLSNGKENLSGNAIAATIEGLRPILVEVQALVGVSAYPTPQRSSTGFDLRRLNMLLAVLEKRCGFRLNQKDVFLNIAGGIKVDDPAIDLAVVASVLSSGNDIAISPKYCFAGEVGLTGEIRAVSKIEQRIAEAKRLGFERIFLSKYQKIASSALDSTDIKVVQVPSLFDLFKNVLPK